jgi:hypothetical protein
VPIDIGVSLDAGGDVPLDVGGGVGLFTGIEEEPARGADIVLRLSKDRGETFGVGRERSLGELGEYDRVVKYRAFGTMRNAAFDVRISDPVEVTFDAQAVVAVS